MQSSCVSRTCFFALLCGVFGLGSGWFTGKQAQAECGDYVIMMGDSHREPQPPQQSRSSLSSAADDDSQVTHGHNRLSGPTPRLPDQPPCRGWNCRGRLPGNVPASPRDVDGGVKNVGLSTAGVCHRFENNCGPAASRDAMGLLRAGFKNLPERPPQSS